MMIRPYLPVKGNYPELNGVTVYEEGIRYRIFDDRVSYDTGYRPDSPEYEGEIVSALQSQVNVGDTVVVVGGGYGVSAVHAAQCSGDDGSVIVYEAGLGQAETVRRTLSKNDVPARTMVDNAVVAKEISIRGEESADVVVDPTELPDCDVLEMDCEGAELEILENLAIEPRVIIVETHENFGVSEEAVRAELASRGYRVIERETGVESRGIYILTAVAESAL